MTGSILSAADRRSLGNGMCLRLLSAYELIEARREARKLSHAKAEQALCSNACLIARALESEGERAPFFADGRQVLLALTAEEIEALAAHWDAFRRESGAGLGEDVEYGVNESFWATPAAVEEICRGRRPRRPAAQTGHSEPSRTMAWESVIPPADGERIAAPVCGLVRNDAETVNGEGVTS